MTWIGKYVGTKGSGGPYGMVVSVDIDNPSQTPMATLKTGPRPYQRAHVCVSELMELDL